MQKFPKPRTMYAAIAATLAAALLATACGQRPEGGVVHAGTSSDAPTSETTTTTASAPSSATAALTTSKPAPAPQTTTTTRVSQSQISETKRPIVTTPPQSEDALPPGALRLPSHESDTVPAAAWDGAAIVSDTNRTCVWLRHPDGKKVAALWPKDYFARFDPLRIFDESGREVWREGQLRDIGGGGSPVHVDRIPSKCRTGDTAWWMAPLEQMK